MEFAFTEVALKTQIRKNIQIQSSTDQNIELLVRCRAIKIDVLNFEFGHWYLFEICILVLENFIIRLRLAFG